MNHTRNIMVHIGVLVSFCVQLLLPITSFSLTHATTVPCKQTPNPQLCEPLGTNETQPTLHKTLTVTKAHGEQALQLVSAMNITLFDQRARSAHADCVELYEDSVHHINKCISSNHPTDVQTWLSAALTNLETCNDGFINFNLSSHLKLFPSILSNYTKLLSNSLALNKALISYPPAVSSGANKNFPEWILEADCRILQDLRRSPPHLVVAQDGTGQYYTINEALNELPMQRNGITGRFVIHVKAGVYREYVEIKKDMPNITFIGDGIDATIVIGNKNRIDGCGVPSSPENCGPFHSGTFEVEGEGFIAQGITFENTAGPEKHQAVALRSSSDKSIFLDCSFKGYQDTLYLHRNRQLYRNCDIYGTIDFIFGDAAAILQNCNIYVRKPLTEVNQYNVITAQGRKDPRSYGGIVIHNSLVVAAPDLAPNASEVNTYLGRPWKKYSRTVFVKCFLGHLIHQEGWIAFDNTSDLGALYYGEYMNVGPGADTRNRVNWPGYHRSMSLAEVKQFSFERFLENGSLWISDARVPVTSIV